MVRLVESNASPFPPVQVAGADWLALIVQVPPLQSESTWQKARSPWNGASVATTTKPFAARSLASPSIWDRLPPRPWWNTTMGTTQGGDPQSRDRHQHGDSVISRGELGRAPGRESGIERTGRRIQDVERCHRGGEELLHVGECAGRRPNAAVGSKTVGVVALALMKPGAACSTLYGRAVSPVETVFTSCVVTV